MKSKFVYVSYIKTTPETLWQALTTPQLIVYFTHFEPAADMGHLPSDMEPHWVSRR
jgi:uncharacterized protein YndB with AHSA1/START domain